MQRSRSRPNLPALTSLRFFAAFVVVAFHYNPDRFVNLPVYFRGWFETGYEAVTFFFVLSGFIMSYIYADFDTHAPRKLDLRSFFVARFGRLAPAYYVGLLISLPFVIGDAFIWAEEPPVDFAVRGVLVLGFLQAWWPPAALAWNPPAWSISVEWFLYAAFPLLVIASYRLSGRRMLLISFLLVAAVAAIRLCFMDPLVDEDASWHNFAQYFPLFHLAGFYFGMALGRLQLSGKLPSPLVAAVMCVLSIAILMVRYSGLLDVPASFSTDAILVLVFGALIIGASQPGHFMQRALSVAPLTFLGEVSYSIYVLHEPVAMWWEQFEPDDYLPVPLQFIAYFAVVLAVSILCYLFVETPLRRLARRWGAAA